MMRMGSTSATTTSTDAGAPVVEEEEEEGMVLLVAVAEPEEEEEGGEGGGEAARPQPFIPVAATVEDFEGYINYRVLDSIAYPGTYKKFMLARKDQEADWAVRLSGQIQAVQASLQVLEIKEQELRCSALSPLHIVWQHVAESNLPPSDLPLTIASCAISRKVGIPCVIVKGKGRGAQPFTVNSRFAGFLFDAWIICKMDVLIKTFARQCMEAIDPEGCLPMAEVVRAFQAHHGDLTALARSFHAGYCHVYRSTVLALQNSI
jgi:hypothetical protein